ncbi:hypothetical protein ACQVWG_26605 [Bacillus cereus]|uniref:hypothetical protein n=1 Tax=Bacillus cereus TaxID=1396 RepID=UPI003D656951
MEIKLNVDKNLFLKDKNDHTVILNISEPSHVYWKSRKDIGYNVTGVYVIFDEKGGEQYDLPNDKKLKSATRNCLYIGEGQILRRLNIHNNHTTFGNLAGEVMYYNVPDIADRKLLERMLIKHYVPIFNKEGQYPYILKKAYKEDITNYKLELINLINDMQIENNLPPSGEAMIDDLFNNEYFTLSEIDTMLYGIIQNLNKDNNQYYQDKRNWY